MYDFNLQTCHYITLIDENGEVIPKSKPNPKGYQRPRKLTSDLAASARDLHAQGYPVCDISFILDISDSSVEKALA